MYCTKCGVQLDETSRYCGQCGAATGLAPVTLPVYHRLERPLEGRKIAGVCAGLANYWGVDPTLVRVVFVALAIFPALPAIIPYIGCWIIMPNEMPRALPQPAAGHA